MDNRINEIFRKISTLRSGMPDLEAAVRDQVNCGLDCTENSLRLIGMRKELAHLVGEWKAAGGGDLSLHLQQRIGSGAVKHETKLVRSTPRR